MLYDDEQLGILLALNRSQVQAAEQLPSGQRAARPAVRHQPGMRSGV